jgi:CRISPR/Cas system-associated exonuclease Cas4 (RecB family)
VIVEASTEYRTFGLSKSRISAFEQCPRRLWQQAHARERSEIDTSTQMSFAAGNAVGDLACSQVKDGIMVEAHPDLQAALARTADLVAAADRPIFEATFQHDGVLVRVDILVPENSAEGLAWHIYEVKSSGSAKPYHIGDLATQYWVIAKCGVAIASASIRHIDTSFVLKTTGDYKGIFSDASLMSDISGIAAMRAVMVKEIRQMLAGDEPVCATGSHCSAPFSCEFSAHCSSFEPDSPAWPIGELRNTGARLAEKWANNEIFEIAELPEDAGLNPLHTRIRAAVRTGEVYLDREGARAATNDWAFPRIWLDFETIGFAVLRWLGTTPYEQVPFQFSAHVEHANGELDHAEALDLSGQDPREGIAKALADLPAKGAVIAWNAGFERRCLRLLSDAVPRYRQALLSLAERTVDLLPIAKNNYYHRDQRGSFSIKAVLPTLLPELDYADLQVADGGAAQLAYIEATDAVCLTERRAELTAGLIAYCERDTLAMVEIYRKLVGGWE